MEIRRIHREFQLFADKVDSQVTPDFLPEEIDTIYHEAELRVIKQTYGTNNIYQKGFQEIQKRTDDLSTLVKVGYLAPEKLSDNLVKYDLTRIHSSELVSDEVPKNDYMIYLGSSVLVNHPKKEGLVYAVPHIASLDTISRILADPYNKPKAHRPIITFRDNAIFLHKTNEFEVEAFEIHYLKYPVKVSYKDSISSELPEHKQREALQLAVRIALGVIESPRVQEQNEQLSTLE